MTKRMSWMSALWALGVVMSISSSASALTRKDIAKTGVSMVGMVFGIAYIATAPNDGSGCTWISMGSGGLSDNYDIYGTSGADTFLYAPSPTTFCGWELSPLTTNGKYVDFHGQGGNDLAVAGPSGSTVYGDGGNDSLYPGPFTGSRLLRGGNNDDTLSSLGQTSLLLWGEAGNDRVCGHPTIKVTDMSGDSGWDTHCGDSLFGLTYSGFEASNCSVCGY